MITVLGLVGIVVGLRYLLVECRRLRRASMTRLLRGRLFPMSTQNEGAGYDHS